MGDPAADRLEVLGQELKELFVERHEFIDGALAALLAREHVLIVGPPGSAKSMIAHALCSRISGATYFHWLLTKFSTPEELFGPVSLKGLEQDRYYRITEGKLPKAHIVFLDEIFKANSAILNALLTLINERVYYNDATPTAVPLNTLFGASNLLPETRELDCLFDRFLFRYQVDYIEDSSGFRTMIAAPESRPPSASLTLDELRQAQVAASTVTVSDQTLDWLTEIRTRIRGRGISVSDRRFRLSIKGLKAHAYLNGRTEVNEGDLRLLGDMLWTVPEERSLVEEVITAVAMPRLHAALEIVHQAEDVHSKAMQAWFNQEEERAAVTEAQVKLVRLKRRLDNICQEEVREELRPRLGRLARSLGICLRDVEARQEQLGKLDDKATN